MKTPRALGTAVLALTMFFVAAAPGIPRGITPPLPLITSNDHALTSPAVGGNGYRVELASGLVPPGRAGCGGNPARVVVSSWGTLTWRDISSQQNHDITLPFPTPDALSYQVFGDPQLARLKNGDLVYLRQGSITTPFSPKPPWFSYNNSYWRGALYIWTSHCGDQWKLRSIVDAKDVFGGQCAWPQQPDTGQHWFGGFDRSTMYVDPFDGTLYVTANCVGGTASVNGQQPVFDHQVMVSLPNGSKQWSDDHPIWPHNVPEGLTSTSDGRLYMLRCDDSVPMVYVSIDQGKTFDAGTNVSTVSGPAGQCTYGDGFNGPQQKLVGASMLVDDYQVSRLGAHAIRAAYPALVDGRIVVRVENVYFNTDSGPTTTLPTLPNGQPVLKGAQNPPPPVYLEEATVVKASSADGSIGHFAMTEADVTGPLGDDSPNVATVHWVEFSPSTQQAIERFGIVHGAVGWADAQTISKTPWAYQLLTNGWSGDYQYGGFAYWGGACRFLMPWAASEKSVNGPNEWLHYAIAQVKDCGVVTTPALPGPSAQLAPSAVPPVTAVVPTTPPFVVTAMTLQVDDCTRADTNPSTPWICPTKAHFTITPGTGGTFIWQVHVSNYYDCPPPPDPDDLVQFGSTVTVADGQTSADATGQLEFPVNHAPVPKNAPPDFPRSIATGFVVGSSVKSADVQYVSDAACKP